MITWARLQTENHYTFLAYRTKKGHGDIIILAQPTEWTGKSLTNNMEEVLKHLVLGITFGAKDLTNVKFYQWCDGEGLFEVVLWWVKKITKDMPPVRLDKVEWKFISKDLKSFEVLYCD